MANDCVEIIQPRPPSEYVADAIGASDELRRIAKAARDCFHGEVHTRDPLHRLNNLEN